MVTQTADDEYLISILGERRLWLLHGAMQVAPVYTLHDALIAAHRNIAAKQPVLCITLSPADEIMVDPDQMYRLWQHIGLLSN